MAFKNKITIMSLVILLSSSSFFLPIYLADKLQANHFNVAQLAFAEKLSLIKAFEIKRTQQAIGTEKWLFYTTKLAKLKGHVAFELAQFYLPIKQNFRSENITRTAIAKGIFWYQQAIRLECEPAKLALAQWYFLQRNVNKANELVDSLSLQTSESAVLKSKILIEQGVETKSEKKALTDQIALLVRSEQGKILIKDIQHYQILSHVISDKINTNIENLKAPLCTASIQLFATSLANLYKTEQLIRNFKLHRLNEFVCFTSIRYRSINKFNCYSKAALAFKCDESQWVDIADNIKTRFVGVMLPRGGANVHLGMLYIDQEDTSDVFAHEISHLIGFVDEYPLPANHEKCQKVQSQAFSENIAVLANVYFGKRAEIRANILNQLPWAKNIKLTTPVLHRANIDKNKLEQTWLLGTPRKYSDKVGVFLSESCDNSHQQAFKPVFFQTQLRYAEKPFPEVYSRIFRDNNTAFLMPSFYYNIALALNTQHDISLVQVWLNKAMAFEHKSRRKNKILTATF